MRSISASSSAIEIGCSVRSKSWLIFPTASSRLQMSALLHSAHYLPPEVAQGKTPTPASDVYSLGAILFEMLSGQPPFQADSPFAIAVKHLHDPPPALRRFNPGVPKAVEGIVLKCLQKEPGARYESTGALLADLRDRIKALEGRRLRLG